MEAGSMVICYHNPYSRLGIKTKAGKKVVSAIGRIISLKLTYRITEEGAGFLEQIRKIWDDICSKMNHSQCYVEVAGVGRVPVDDLELILKNSTGNVTGILKKGNDGNKVISRVNKIGDFTNLKGCTVDDILDRIPDGATLRELHPIPGKVTEGFEFKWVYNGQTYRVRVHNADPSAPVGSNAFNGWIVRIQRGTQFYDYTTDTFQPARFTNPKGPDFDSNIMNNTHIPILDPYKP